MSPFLLFLLPPFKTDSRGNPNALLRNIPPHSSCYQLVKESLERKQTILHISGTKAHYNSSVLLQFVSSIPVETDDFAAFSESKAILCFPLEEEKPPLGYEASPQGGKARQIEEK